MKATKTTPIKMNKRKKVSLNPLDKIDYTGSIAVDSAAECAGVTNEFKERAKQERKRYDEATDSEYWVCVCFQTREEKEEFLRNADLIQHGDKYLDGAVVAEKLGVEMNLSDRKVKPLKDHSSKFRNTISKIKGVK